MAKAPKSRKPAKRPAAGRARPVRGGSRAGGKSARAGGKSARAKRGASPAGPGRARAARTPQVPAPPSPAPPPARPAERDDGQERALSAVHAGLDKKAEEPVVLDVRGLSGVADYFVVMSADSDRQAAAIADAVDDRLEGLGAVRLGAEGRSGGGWVLLDYGSVVVHVMGPETRRFYDLEGLWADAPRVPAR